MREACAVFGVYSSHEESVSNLTYFALFALQHRGQESSGMAVANGESIEIHKEMGLVSQVFSEEILQRMQGFIAIGHNRYSTTGRSNLENAQPLLLETPSGSVAWAHNGNLVNYEALRSRLESRGIPLQTTSDSEIIGKLFAEAQGDSLERKLRNAAEQLEGAYSVVFCTKDTLAGFRDPLGIRPLCLGRLNRKNQGGWVISSESCALHTVGAEFVREVKPGEAVIIDRGGLRSVMLQSSEKTASCIFEYVYFVRPDSLLSGVSVYEARLRLGRELARQAPVEADGVMAVPDSSIPAAIGYSLESGLPFFEGLIKNRYIARTFIQPEERLRRIGVRLKFHPLRENLEGRRVVVVDDSIVRGHTTKAIVALLREAGAKEIHLRITSPPIRHPCNLGIDMATYEELIANNKTVEQIRDYLGADSLYYLNLEGLIRSAVGEKPGESGDVNFSTGEGKFCTACLSGKYPIPFDSSRPLVQSASC